MHLLIALRQGSCFGFESGKMGRGGRNACVGARGVGYFGRVFWEASKGIMPFPNPSLPVLLFLFVALEHAVVGDEYGAAGKGWFRAQIEK